MIVKIFGSNYPILFAINRLGHYSLCKNYSVYQYLWKPDIILMLVGDWAGEFLSCQQYHTDYKVSFKSLITNQCLFQSKSF